MKPKQIVDQEAEEWKGKYMRALADYQNLERRNLKRERLMYGKFASETILIADPYSHSIPCGGQRITLKTQDWIWHLKNLSRYWRVRELRGSKPSETLFDPHQMECIDVVEGEENKVVEELRQGYRLTEKY